LQIDGVVFAVAAHEIGAGVWHFLRLSLALKVAGYPGLLITSIAGEKAYPPKVVLAPIGTMVSICGSIACKRIERLKGRGTKERTPLLRTSIRSSDLFLSTSIPPPALKLSPRIPVNTVMKLMRLKVHQ
jgi:hypothetical protein